MSIYSPQELVDQINAAYIPELFTSDLPAKERTAKSKLARQKLRTAKQSLKAEQTFIKDRWDNRNKQEAEQERIQLTPYNLVQAYLAMVENAYNELDAAWTAGSELPAPFALADVIVGDADIGEYRITSKSAGEEWYQGKQRELSEEIARVRKEAFTEAKRLIEGKQYYPARRILESMPDVPLAQQWLEKIKPLEQKQLYADMDARNKAQAKKAKEEENSKALAAFIWLIFAVIAVIAAILKMVK